MQFSLDKFFEMMEARFGKLPVTILLATIGAAFFVFGIHTTVTLGVIPLYLIVADLLRGAQVTIGPRELTAIFTAGLLPGLSVFVVYQLVIKRMLRTAHETIDRSLVETIDVVRSTGQQSSELLEAMQVEYTNKINILREAFEGTVKLIGESQEDLRQRVQELREIHNHGHKAIEDGNIAILARYDEANKKISEKYEENNRKLSEAYEEFRRDFLEATVEQMGLLDTRISKLEQTQSPSPDASQSPPD